MTMSNLRTNSLLPQFVFPVATVTTTTGSPGTGSITADSNGFTWNYWRWTAAGSVTIGTAGYADLLVVGGGAGGESNGGWNSGGGAGGVRFGLFWIPVGTYTITIGAGGNGGGTSTVGATSSFGSILLCGGGNRARANSGSETNYGNSAIGGGGSGGGVSIQNAGSGYTGGGAGGTLYGGAGNTGGIPLNYAGSSVTYGVGGASGAGSANTGNAGFGANAGGSGIVIMKIRTN